MSIVGKTQYKRESQSSNYYFVPIETQGTIVLEIQPPVALPIDKGKCIVSELPQFNSENFLYDLNDFNNFFMPTWMGLL